MGQLYLQQPAHQAPLQRSGRRGRYPDEEDAWYPGHEIRKSYPGGDALIDDFEERHQCALRGLGSAGSTICEGGSAPDAGDWGGTCQVSLNPRLENRP